MYEYSGLEDPTRESPDPWGLKDLNDRVSSLFQNDVNVKDAPRPVGFTLKNLPGQVCSFAELLSLSFLE